MKRYAMAIAVVVVVVIFTVDEWVVLSALGSFVRGDWWPVHASVVGRLVFAAGWLWLTLAVIGAALKK